MIIFNDTFIIDPNIETEWLTWIKDNHIPAVLATPYFEKCTILKVLNSPNEGITYCLQFYTNTYDKYEKYKANDADAIKNNHFLKFENKFVSFDSIMELGDQYESNKNTY